MIDIQFFGQFLLTVQGDKQSLSSLQQRILFLLCLDADRGITDAQIVDRCNCSTTSIKGAIRKVRIVLEPGIQAKDSKFIIKKDERYQFLINDDIYIDLRDFLNSIDIAGKAEAPHQLDDGIANYEKAIELFSVPLFGLERNTKDPDWQYALQINKELEHKRLKALEQLAHHLVRVERYSDALSRLKETIDLKDEADNENHLKAMMVCYFQLGQKYQIQQIYEDIRDSKHDTHQLQAFFKSLLDDNRIPKRFLEAYSLSNAIPATSTGSLGAFNAGYIQVDRNKIPGNFLQKYSAGEGWTDSSVQSPVTQLKTLAKSTSKLRIAGVVVIALLALANYIWADWYNIVNRPGLDQIEFSQEPIPLADPNRFSVLVADFENDENNDHQRLLIEALKEYDGIQVLKLNRGISLDGPIPEQMVDQGHIAARSYLEESGASMAIWGVVISIDDLSRPKLYWTTTEGDEIKSSFYFHENVFQLPDLFFEDLIDVLQLLIASREAEFNHQRGRYSDEQLLQLIQRVNNLLTGSTENFNWDNKSKGTTLRILGDALAIVGEKNEDSGILQKAIDTFHEALKVLTHEQFPIDWAMIHNNLAIALAKHGAITNSVQRFEEAISAYQSALEVFQRQRLPIGWARIQSNLASVLIRIGERELGTKRLEQAVEISKEALEEMTYARAPLGWAGVQFNLGTALMRLGEKEKNGTQHLVEAVAAFENVLQEFTQELFPAFWARTQNTMGTALTRLGEREDSGDRFEHAASAFQAALKEVTRDRNSMEWARIQSNLGMALLRLGEKRAGTEYVEPSAAAFKSALEVFTRDANLLEWTITQNNLGTALVNLGNSKEHFERAKTAFENALEGFEALGIPAYVQLAKDNLDEAQTLIEARQD